MRRALLIASVAVLPASALAGGLTVLGDHRDSFQSVRVAQMTPDVAAQGKVLEEFLTSTVPRHLPDVEKGLGSPSCHWPDSTFVMPLVQSRLVLMPGLYVPPNRSHAEFYAVDSVGGLQVWYLSDSTTVSQSKVYLKADSRFLPCTRETQNQLGTRLLWDQEHLADLERALRKRFGK